MGRSGRTKSRTEPERRCIATGQVLSKSRLIRFVVGPEAQVVPDIAGKLPGRGIWVAAERPAMDRAVAKRLFARAARQPVEVAADLAEQVEGQLVDRVVGLISLARKAGLAVAGYEKVKDWLAKEQATVLVQASDGSGRGKSKLRAPNGEASYIGVLTGSELGLAFGREHVIHGALAAGGLTQRVVEDAARLSGLRKSAGNGSAGKETKT